MDKCIIPPYLTISIHKKIWTKGNLEFMKLFNLYDNTSYSYFIKLKYPNYDFINLSNHIVVIFGCTLIVNYLFAHHV